MHRMARLIMWLDEGHEPTPYTPPSSVKPAPEIKKKT
jgi:hypothetical protein